MEVVQILKDARSLIADEKNWIQGYYSCDAEKVYVLPDDPTATCFCSLGAIHRVSEISAALPLPEDLVRFLVNDQNMGDCGESSGDAKVAYFNDRRSHVAVLSLFDRAIARAQSEAVQ